MPAYHSKLGNVGTTLGNMAYLSFKLTTPNRGPIQLLDKNHLNEDSMDIIDEALFYFKPNVFFRSYEIQSDADRIIIYLTLYITECLKILQKCDKHEQALMSLYGFAVSRFDIPGDPNFPLNSVFQRPTEPDQVELMRNYMQQLRIECSYRLVEKVFPKQLNQSKPNKWWICFSKRKFMDKSLK